ncbi:hypothetical protein HOLleu_39263 [Holothuria leucospilota]|uniref:Secreted protein n=1 Tax=Holothuria leucospilota TaxID=206669 RepID=A0A9Q0YGB4_HOLLE|nr:hypothetical protein HOLleu_39263 [Holothuria leucospilota]
MNCLTPFLRCVLRLLSSIAYLALSLFASGTSSYSTARCRSTTVPSSTCMHYQPLDQTRITLSKGFFRSRDTCWE